MSHDLTGSKDFADAHVASPEVVMEEGPAATFSGLSQAELQLLADNQPTLCWIAAADGYIVWYNLRWHEYCGTTSTEMEGWGWQSVHDPTILPQVMTRWTASIAAGVPFEMTFPLKGADGIYRPFLTRVAPLKNSRGEVIRWFGNNIDVTAQLRSEAARQEAEDRLHALNAEHDREQMLVAEANLANEREVAVLREQFIAVLGHDLRNPLAALDAGTRVLLREAPSERARNIGSMMQQSVVRMAALIDNILDFARGRLGGAFHVDRQRTALEPTLQQVVAEIQSTCPDRTFETRFMFDGPVNCDAARIAQLFSNLLGNAVTHGPADGLIQVHGSTRGGLFSLVVTNPSEEIPPATLERLFQPFVRGEGAPNRRGLGLGLFIACEIAKAHDGTLTAAWRDGRTIFSFEMPAN